MFEACAKDNVDLVVAMCAIGDRELVEHRNYLDLTCVDIAFSKDCELCYRFLFDNYTVKSKGRCCLIF